MSWRLGNSVRLRLQTGMQLWRTYKGVSKSPRTMLITCKSLVVHEFPARVCCGGVFQKGTSRDASKHGKNAGPAVFMQKGSTLKVMEEFNIQGKQTSFYKYCPGTFGYILVSDCNDINRAWENIIENIKTSAKESLGLHKVKQHKPWLMKNV